MFLGDPGYVQVLFDVVGSLCLSPLHHSEVSRNTLLMLHGDKLKKTHV